MSKLYRTDPEKFKQISAREIEHMISRTCPEVQNGLRGLQFRIDSTLAKYKNPQMRMEKMEQLLFEYGLNRLNEALHFIPLNNKRNERAEVVSLFPQPK